MSNLAMCVTGLPEGMRVTQLSVADAPALSALVTQVERAYFGRSEANEQETRGSLNARELHGARGTAGIWHHGRLVAAALAYDEVANERGLPLELVVHPSVPARERIADRLLDAAQRYAGLLEGSAGSWLKTEAPAGDREVATALATRGYEQHRTYLRMRIDFDRPPPPPVPVRGLTIRAFRDSDWLLAHDTLVRGFVGHYDYHPLPFEDFQRDNSSPTSDPGQWRLVFDGPGCVGVLLGSNRYAEHKVGYVENISVLPDHRRRGIAGWLLADAFARDAGAGFTCTTLHCDATNPTGANQLYERLGLYPDQEHTAWRARVEGRFAPSRRD